MRNRVSLKKMIFYCREGSKTRKKTLLTVIEIQLAATDLFSLSYSQHNNYCHPNQVFHHAP